MLAAGRLRRELRKKETWKPWQWDCMGMRMEKRLEGRNCQDSGSEQMSSLGTSRVTPEFLVGASGSTVMP